MFRVSVPQTVSSDKAGYEFIAGIYPTVIAQEDKEITIGFDECNSFDGNLASALGAVLDTLLTYDFKIWITRPKARNVRKVLARNHFLIAWEVETLISDKENYVHYQKFPLDDEVQFKKYIDSELIHKQKFPAHTDLVGEKMVESICEIYANAIMHGKSKYVYACGEYQEDDKILNMTIVDCGETVAKNVNSFFVSKGKEQVSAAEAIEWAFVSGNTTKADTGGLGLAILKEFIDQNQGSLQMVSDTGMLEFNKGTVKKEALNNSFPGTIVNMKFNFADPKKYFMVYEKNTDFNDLL